MQELLGHGATHYDVTRRRNILPDYLVVILKFLDGTTTSPTWYIYLVHYSLRTKNVLYLLYQLGLPSVSHVMRDPKLK